MSERTRLNLIYYAGLVQGLALVTFPAASAIFTSRDGYDFSATRYGWMFLPQVVMAIVASSTSPRLARRWSLKRVLLYGLGSDLIAMLLLVLSRFVQHESDIAFAILLAATGALGLGFGATLMALNTFAQGLSPAHKDRAVLTLNALLGAGTALAPALVALFLALGAWWLLPVCVSCALVVLLFLMANQPLQLPTEDVASSGKVVGNSRKLPLQLWPFAGAVLLYGILETLNGNWATVYLVSQRGISVEAASWVLTTFWAMVTIGRLLFAVLSPKVSERLVYAVLPFLLAIALQATSHAKTEVGGLAAFGLAGLACSAFFPLTISFAGTRFPGLSSVTSGALIAFYQMGYGVTAFGSGPLKDSGGFLFSTIFAGASALAVGMGVLAILIARTMPR